MTNYEPEAYWSRVAQEIEKRGDNYIAGDDNPYYRYKRRKFLKEFLDTIDFQSKTVLEVGFGPGGNLKHLAMNHAPKRMFGADISEKMLELATKNLSKHNVTLSRIDGANLPYPAQAVDISFTVTVLHHVTDDVTFKRLAQELCRVTKTTIVIMEDIGAGQSGVGWIARPVEIYRSVFAECGFKLSNVRFLNTKISRRWYESIDRRFISRRHQEGDPISFAMKCLIGLPMPIMHRLDEVFVEKGNLAKMVFQRA